MPNYEEEEKTVEVPKAAGIKAYLAVLEKILALPMVDTVTVVITPGTVKYHRYRRPEEPEEGALGLDLETLLPFAVIRSHQLVEVAPSAKIAAIVIAQMLAHAHLDGLNPVAFASGHNATVRKWHAHTTGIVLPPDEMYGLPFLVDRQLPTEALFLCAAYGKNAALVDTIKTYKVTIPWSPK
jgi:hypothetical protein